AARRVADGDDGTVESLRIAARRASVPADFAHELQRGGADLLIGGGSVGAAEGLDASAHEEKANGFSANLGIAVDFIAVPSDVRRVSPNVVLPFCSSVVSFAFASAVLAQWSRRRQAFQLVWAVGLLWYGISAGTEFLGSA